MAKSNLIEIQDHFYPYEFFESTTKNFGIIILNYSIDSLRRLLRRDLWEKAICRACADGGANILKRFSDEKNYRFIPNYISGDFDSIDRSTRDYYQQYSPPTEFISTHDQSATDFTKCVRVMMEKIPQLNHLLVFCSLGGRFDHSVGIIHSLYLLNTRYPHLQINLLTDHDLAFLLHAQRWTRIHLQSPYRGHVCSLLPFGKSARVKTNGLKWNLDLNQELSFKTLVSSSNGYESSETMFVDIFTDEDIIWTMTYHCDLS